MPCQLARCGERGVRWRSMPRGSSQNVGNQSVFDSLRSRGRFHHGGDVIVSQRMQGNAFGVAQRGVVGKLMCQQRASA